MATRLIPFQEGMKVGLGYDLVKGTPLTFPSVQGSISSIQGAGGQQVVSHLLRVSDLASLHETLGVNVDAGGSYFGASADVKVNYAKECNVSTQSTTLVVGVTVVDAFESFDAPVLTSDANELLTQGNNTRFRERFGDVFIDGLRKGGEYFATFEITSVDESTREDIAVHVEGAFHSGVAAAHLETDISDSKKQTTSHTDVRVHVYQNGAVTHTDQDFAEMLQKAHDFPPTVAGNLAAPFAVSLADYTTLKLPDDKFNFIDRQQQRDVLAEHARKRFELMTLLNDIRYVRAHPEDFESVNPDALRLAFTQVTDNINVMEREASACLRDASLCKFTPFDVTDFRLPRPIKGSVPVPAKTMVAAPDVMGMDALSACRLIAAVGLVPGHGTADRSGDPSNLTLVVQQDVPPGAEIPKGALLRFRYGVRPQEMPDAMTRQLVGAGF